MVNYKQTREKLLKFCDNLFNNGVISEEDYKKCKTSFTNFGSIITGEYPEPGTNKKFSFGMSKNQGINDFDMDLTVQQQMRCIIKTKFGFTLNQQQIEKNKKDGRMNEKILFSEDESNTLSLSDMSTEQLMQSDNAKNIVFLVQRQSNNYYTIQNEATENYIKVSSNPEYKNYLEIDTNNITDSAYFEMKKKGKYYTFTSMIKPGYKITSDTPIKLSNGSRAEHNWTIQMLNDSLLEGDNEFEITKNSMNVVTKIINELRDASFEYYKILSLIKFNRKLHKKISEVTRNSELYDAIQKNINVEDNMDLFDEMNRIRIDNIDNVQAFVLDNLDKEREKLIEQRKYVLTTSVLPKRYKLSQLDEILDKFITKKKIQIKDINILFRSIVGKHKNISVKQNVYDQKIDELNNSSEINHKNLQKVKKNLKYRNLKFYITIILYISLIICILFFGYKLYKEIMKY